MKVVFCSNNNSFGMYESFLSISVMTSIMDRNNTIIIQGQGSGNLLEYAFTPFVSSNTMKEDFEYYNKRGMDQIVSRATSGNLTKENLWDNVVHVPNSNIFYVPSSRKNNVDLYNYEMDESIDSVISMLNTFNENIFISLDNIDKTYCKKIVEWADVIVVCMHQCEAEIKKKNASFEKHLDKMLFLITDYDSESKHNIHNIKRRQSFAGKKIFSIPYNIHYRDAVYDGRTYEFINNSVISEKYDDNAEFVRSLKKITEIILKKRGGYERKSLFS